MREICSINSSWVINPCICFQIPKDVLKDHLHIHQLPLYKPPSLPPWRIQEELYSLIRKWRIQLPSFAPLPSSPSLSFSLSSPVPLQELSTSLRATKTHRRASSARQEAAPTLVIVFTSLVPAPAAQATPAAQAIESPLVFLDDMSVSLESVKWNCAPHLVIKINK